MAFPEPNQMRFNLQTPANPINMTTRFNLRPTPIVLQRVTSSVPSPQGTVVTSNPMPFEERMKVASRLAQREMERNSLYCPPDTSNLGNFTGRISSISSNNKGANTGLDGFTTGQNPKQEKIDSIREQQPKQCVVKLAKPVADPPSLRVGKIIAGKHVDHGETLEEGVESEIDRTTHEIVKLRKDLTRKMQKLKLLSLKADLAPPPTVVTSSSSPFSRGGRLSWVGEEKVEEKRELKKSEGQAARSNRMLYQLQQKVREAQKGLRGPSKYNQKDKLLAMNTLASAHRAAVRTLHHLISMGVTQGVTHGSTHQRATSRNELTGLVEQLSKLCVEARVPNNGKEDSEDEQLVSILRELSEYHAQVKQSLNREQRPNLVPPDLTSVVADKTKPPRRKKKLRQQKRPGGVLVNPKFRSKKFVLIRRENEEEINHEGVPHFAKQTFASIQKKSPKKLSNFPPSSLVPFTPHLQPPCPLSPPNHHSLHPPYHSSHSPQPSSPCSTVSNHAPLAPLSPSSSSSPSLAMTQPSHVKSSHDSGRPPAMPWEQEGQNMVEREMARQAWLDTRTMELAQELEKRKNGQMRSKQCEEERERRRRKTQNQLVQEETECDAHTEQKNTEKLVDDHTDDLQHDTSEEMDTRGNVEGVGPILQRPALESIMERIQEMEKERNILRSKWQSVSYGGDARPNPHVNIVRPSVNNRGPISVPLSNKQITNLQEYRERYGHYLSLTGVRTDGGFDPWGLVDEICEEILEELLHDMAQEVHTVMDDCVEQVYDTEFQHPV